MARLGDMLIPQTKSKIKAGTGKENGKYKFFTSSNIQNKFIDEYQYDDTALIFGTGGNASIHFCDEKFSTSTDCLVFFAKEKYILKTIYFYLSGNMNILENGFKGAGLKHISKQYILDIEIPLPPLEEQRKIAAVLDNVSDLIAKRRQQLDKLDELVKSRFVEMFGDLKSNPQGWPVVPFSEFAKIDGNMTTDYEKYADYPHIGIDSIEKGTGELKGYRTVREDGVISGKYIFTPQHIIYSKIRPNLNKVALPDFYGVCSADAYPILPNRLNCNRVFLAAVMRSEYYLDYILQFSSRTNLPKVNRKEIAGFCMPLPPMALQNQFAAFVKQTDKSKLAVQKSLEKLETLKKALMQEYFG